MFDFASYQARALHLDKGDTLVVYSDGLTDAENPNGEMFGEKRLLEIIRQEAPAGSCAVERELLKAIEDFTQGIPQTDDITFVIVERAH
jgi:sigma-B regulation protein RsbU (phosphoserine phosphatase)